MQRFKFIPAVGLVVGLGALLWFGGRSPVPGKSDLSVVLVGFTNSPLRTPGVSVSGWGTGLHALFAITNASQKGYLRFQTVAVERQEGQRWTEIFPGHAWRGIEGGGWPPGVGMFEAVPWPEALATNSTWRLRISVAHDVTPFSWVLNAKLGREFFQPDQGITITGPDVSLTVPFQLLSSEGLTRSK